MSKIMNRLMGFVILITFAAQSTNIGYLPLSNKDNHDTLRTMMAVVADNSVKAELSVAMLEASAQVKAASAITKASSAGIINYLKIKKVVSDLPSKAVEDKIVLLRGDINIGNTKKLKTERLTKLRALLPDIRFLLEQGVKLLVIASHNGRAKDFKEGREDGEVDDNYSFKPVAGILETELGQQVSFVSSCIGEEVEKAVEQAISEGVRVLLLEDTRFWEGETAKGAKLDLFARRLGKAIKPEIFVNSASATFHRHNGSVGPVAEYIDGAKVLGLQAAKELGQLYDIFDNPEKSVVLIMGGVKLDKLDVMESLLTNSGVLKDIIVIGPLSLAFAKEEAKAKKIMELADKKGVRLSWPGRGVVVEIPDDYEGEPERLAKDLRQGKIDIEKRGLELKTAYIDSIPTGYIMMDTSPLSMEITLGEAFSGDTSLVVLNGTAGVYEHKRFAAGHNTLIVDVLAFATKEKSKGKPIKKPKLIGGDATTAAVTFLGREKVEEEFEIVTMGGAALSLFGGNEFPVMRYIDDKATAKASSADIIDSEHGPYTISIEGQRLFYDPEIEITSATRELFYEGVLRDAAEQVAINGKGYEIEMFKMDRFRRFLIERNESKYVGELLVEKFYQGRDRFFQMAYIVNGAELLLTFKKSRNPLCRGYSALVQPRERIIVNGYGTVGKKITDALRKQGYEIIAVTNTGSLDKEGRAKPLTYDAIFKGYPLRTALGFEENLKPAREAGLPYEGTLIELLEQLRKEKKRAIVIDASSGGKGVKETRTGWINREELYKPYSDVIKAATYQGGESPEVAEMSFSLATADWKSFKGLNHVQVVSCNTTGLNRNFSGLKQALEEAGLRKAIIIDNNALRREKDPGINKAGAVDEVQIDSSHQLSSRKVSKFLNLPVNIDRVITSAKGLYVHLATVKGIDIKELKDLLFGSEREGRIRIVEDKGEKFQTSGLYKLLYEPDAYKNTIVVKLMPSRIKGEVKVAFGYSMDIEIPEGEGLAIYGMKALFSPLKDYYSRLRKDYAYLRIDDLILIPGSNWGGQLGGISVAPTYHHWKDILKTLNDEDKEILTDINTPASVIPTTHYHIHIATARAEGLTAQMVIGAFKKQSRIAVVDFPKGIFSSAMLFDVVNSSVGEEVKGGSHPMVIIAQVKDSQIKGEVKIIYAVPQESDIVPENCNAIHAILGTFSKDDSRRIVDEALEIDRIKQGIEARFPVKYEAPSLLTEGLIKASSAGIQEPRGSAFKWHDGIFGIGIPNQDFKRAMNALSSEDLDADWLKSITGWLKETMPAYEEIVEEDVGRLRENAEFNLQYAKDTVKTIEGILNHGIRLQEYEGLRAEFTGKTILKEDKRLIPWFLDKDTALGKQIATAQKIGELDEIEKRIGCKAILFTPGEDNIAILLQQNGFSANTHAIGISNSTNKEYFERVGIRLIALDNLAQGQYLPLSLLAMYSKVMLYLSTIKDTKIHGKLMSLAIQLHNSITGNRDGSSLIKDYLDTGVIVLELPTPEVVYKPGELENLQRQEVATLRAA